MVKEGFCFDGRTELHGINGGLQTAIRSLDYIVKTIVRPSDGVFGDEFVIMHDNTCRHVARVVQGYTKEAGIEVMSQLNDGKDLNIIKHCCDFVERRIRKRKQPPQALPEIPQALMVE